MQRQALTAISAESRRLASALDSLVPPSPLTDPDAESVITRLVGAPPDLRRRAIGQGMRILYLETIVDPDRLERLARALYQRARRHAGPGARRLEIAGPHEDVFSALSAAQALLQAKAVVLLAGSARGVAVPIDHWPTRQISEPNSEVVVQGPHNGFVEVLATNVALLRHRIPDGRLRWEELSLGRRTSVRCALFHLEGVVRPGLLATVRRRVLRARPSFLTDSSMLGQWIAQATGAVFPVVGKTERPDVATAALESGRVVIIINGSPVALLLPNLFGDLMHAATDYYNRPYTALFKRCLRLMGMLVALVASPLFVALVTINRELVPTQLFLSIARARAGVPLSAVVEVLLLEVMVEVIRESGLHLPGTLGQTISVVGAVVIGQSAVIAGLISAPSIVVVSVGFICSFILPSSDATLALRIIRYPLILLAALFGILGIASGLALLLAYLCALESFGVPYLAPVVPMRRRGLQDALWRRPLPALRRSFLARRPPPWGEGP